MKRDVVGGAGGNELVTGIGGCLDDAPEHNSHDGFYGRG